MVVKQVVPKIWGTLGLLPWDCGVPGPKKHVSAPRVLLYQINVKKTVSLKHSVRAIRSKKQVSIW